MAKNLYGERWKIVDGPPLGKGGQGTVFRVVDVSGEHEGEFALKRVPDPARHERFRSEIEASKRLQHPNIIKLIDHSALDATNENEEKQFLVTPIARGGDLSDIGRISLYKNDIEAVLRVAKQLSSALAAAHGDGVIHRDVKPENILFTGNGHEVWLTDFGICLIRELKRITETGDRPVGPRAFMAPELEGGGKLDVSASVDVYSLGKVIYYMITGGVILPRERLLESQYSQIFLTSERYGLTQLLLARMICPLEHRIRDMQEVTRGLEQIEDWERSAVLLPISKQALADIALIQRQALEAQRVATENAAARDQEAANLSAVKSSFVPWLESELQKIAALLGSPGVIQTAVRAPTGLDGNSFHFQVDQRTFFEALGGMEIAFQSLSDPFSRVHILQLFLCRERRMRITTGVAANPARDLNLCILPFYRQRLGSDHSNINRLAGYFNSPTRVNEARADPNLRRRGQNQLASLQTISASVVGRGFTQFVEFRASEWPENVERIKAALTEAIDTFIEFIKSGANHAGP